MVVKVLAHDARHVRVLDRGPGIGDNEVDHLCKWVATNLTAQVPARVGDFRLARRAPEREGNCFTFVVDED